MLNRDPSPADSHRERGQGDTDAQDEPDVYGDAAYGSGEFQDTLAKADIRSHCKTQPPSAPAGRFAKDQFDIDLERDTVSCPNGQNTKIRRGKDGDGTARLAVLRIRSTTDRMDGGHRLNGAGKTTTEASPPSAATTTPTGRTHSPRPGGGRALSAPVKPPQPAVLRHRTNTTGRFTPVT